MTTFLRPSFPTHEDQLPSLERGSSSHSGGDMTTVLTSAIPPCAPSNTNVCSVCNIGSFL